MLSFYERGLLTACFAGDTRVAQRLLARPNAPSPEAGLSGLMLGWCSTRWDGRYPDDADATSAMRGMVLELLNAGLRLDGPTEDAEVNAVADEWKARIKRRPLGP